MRRFQAMIPKFRVHPRSLHGFSIEINPIDVAELITVKGFHLLVVTRYHAVVLPLDSETIPTAKAALSQPVSFRQIFRIR